MHPDLHLWSQSVGILAHCLPALTYFVAMAQLSAVPGLEVALAQTSVERWLKHLGHLGLQLLCPQFAAVAGMSAVPQN